jgi:drug/metabolite transporter superfamily protein YnfA
VLLAKPFFLARELSLEALAGLLISVPVVAVQSVLASRVRAALGATAVAAGFLIYELRSAPGPLISFNWIPFLGEITNTLNGVMEVTGLIWVFFLLGALANILAPSYQRREYAVAGGFFVALVVGLCEWLQQFIPGRHGDITTVGIALVGWGVTWRFRDTG